MTAITIVVRLLAPDDKFKLAGNLYQVTHVNQSYYEKEVAIFASPVDAKGLITGNPITIKLPGDTRMKILK